MTAPHPIDTSSDTPLPHTGAPPSPHPGMSFRVFVLFIAAIMAMMPQIWS